MASRDKWIEKFEIDRGPSKLGIMLSHYDTDMGLRTVRFKTVKFFPEYATNRFNVQVVTSTRVDPSATTWDISGTCEVGGVKIRVSIHYYCDTRKGQMRIEDELQTDEVVSNGRRSNIRASAISRMIRRRRVECDGEHFAQFSREVEK